jgi:hypothetical protein
MADLEEFCAYTITRDGRTRPCDRTRREHIERRITHPFTPWVQGSDGWTPATTTAAGEAS